MQYKSKLLKIATMENEVLNSKLFSPLHLGVQLRQIDLERKDLYRMLKDDALIYETVKNHLINEFNRFTDFSYKVLSTKKLAKTVYLEVVKNLLLRYEDVKYIDNKQIAFNHVIECLYGLREQLKNSENKTNSFKIRELTKLANTFIEANQVKQTSI